MLIKTRHNKHSMTNIAKRERQLLSVGNVDVLIQSSFFYYLVLLFCLQTRLSQITACSSDSFMSHFILRLRGQDISEQLSKKHALNNFRILSSISAFL